MATSDAARRASTDGGRSSGAATKRASFRAGCYENRRRCVGATTPADAAVFAAKLSGSCERTIAQIVRRAFVADAAISAGASEGIECASGDVHVIRCTADATLSDIDSGARDDRQRCCFNVRCQRQCVRGLLDPIDTRSTASGCSAKADQPVPRQRP